MLIKCAGSPRILTQATSATQQISSMAHIKYKCVVGKPCCKNAVVQEKLELEQRTHVSYINSFVVAPGSKNTKFSTLLHIHLKLCMLDDSSAHFCQETDNKFFFQVQRASFQNYVR